MKVLHVVHGYFPSMGGSQWLVQRLSEELVARHKDEVTVFTTVARNMEYFQYDDGSALPVSTTTLNGVVVRRFAVYNGLTRLRMLLASLTYRRRLPYNEYFRTLLNGPMIRGLARAVAQSGAEVVFAAAFPLLHMYRTLAGARRAGIPIVLCGALHVEDAWNYDREMIYRAIRKADAYVALTDFERDYVIRRGAEPRRVHVVGGGVDVDSFTSVSEAAAQALRRRYGWGADPVVVTVAKHVARKRFDVVVAALEQVWQTRPQVRLLIAGARTPYTADLEAMIRALAPERRANVALVSDLDEKDKAPLIQACDIFVLASGRDAFGLAFLEAWACRKPVIGIDVGSIASVVSHGKDGLLVAYDDPNAMAEGILRLVADPALGRALGEAGFRKVQENFTWSIVARRIRQIYSKVVAGGL